MNTALLQKLTADKKTTITVVLFAAVILVADGMSLIPWQWHSLGACLSKASSLRSNLKNLNADLARFQQKKNAKKSGEELHPKRIVNEEELSAVFQFIADVANKNGIILSELKPVVATKAAVPLLPAGVRASARLMNVRLSGGYHQIGQFINALENAEYIFMVEEFLIRPQEEGPLNEQAVITLATYVKN